jgi:hypothetical protein
MYTTPLGKMLRDENICFHMYADDTQVYAVSTLEELNDIKEKLERVMKKIQAWMGKNLLKLNPSKTEFMVIRSQYELNELTRGITIAEDDVLPCPKARNIGVVLDNTFSMEPHVSALTKTLNMHLRNIAQVRRYLTKDATEALVHGLFTSRLDYGNSLLAGQPACRLRSLQLAQNSAARIICRLPRREHVTPIMKELHWLPVAYRIMFKLCTLMFKAIHNLAPSYIEHMVEIHVPGRELRSGESLLLTVPRTRTNYGDRALSAAGPRAWNGLPETLRDCADFSDFKGKLKTHLFMQAYYQ